MATIDLKYLKGEQKGPKGHDVVEGSTSGVRIRVKAKVRITLVSGGAESGKSRYVRDYAKEVTEKNRYCILTQQKAGEEEGFTVIHEPIDLVKALKALPAEAEVCIVDCLPDWVENLLRMGETDKAVDELASVLRHVPCDLLLVTSEVGYGRVDAFVSQTGNMNMKLAALADNVIVMIAGIPVAIKGKLL